jgi:signal transduction histidine kinase
MFMSLNKPLSSQSKAVSQQKQTSNARKGLVEFFWHLSQFIRNVWIQANAENSPASREFYFASDKPQARVVIILLTLTIALFSISDYTFFGFSLLFFLLATLRIGLVGYCIYQFRYIGQAKSYRTYDNSTIVYLLIVVIGILAVNFTRSQNFIPHIIVIDMAVFVFYIVMPTRFLFQVVPSLVFSLGELLIISVTFEWFMAPGLFTALFSLAFANVVGALASLQIHSYRWRIFESFIKREETERLAAIGQTAGMIGHDIRNPLQAIVSELYIAKEALAKSRMPKQTISTATESISLIEEQTDYITKIVSDLQDYARPLRPELKEVDLAKLVTSIFLTVRIPSTITLKIDVQGFPKIHTDPTLIRRAITNLVNNALQAMPEGGTLNVTAHTTDQQAFIEVADSGMGIPEEIKPKLFTPLVTTKAKGQGLGLAVVKRLVEALDGAISFESEMGKGTKFTIALPLRK